MRDLPSGAPLAALVLLASACTLDFDLVGPHGGEAAAGGSPSAGAPSTGGSPSGGSAEGGGPQGGSPGTCEGECLPLGGFTGPFRLTDDCASPIRGGYADGSPVVSAANADCTCACEAPSPLGCPAVTSVVFDEISCGGGVSSNVGFSEGVCFAPLLGGLDVYSLTVPTAGGVASGSCESNGALATMAPATFTDPFVACELNPLAPCGESALCLPDNLDGLCVIGEPSDDCPALFPNRREISFEKEVADDRNCTCGCGAFTAGCAPNFDIYTDAACGALDSKTLTPACVSALDSTHMEGIVYRPLATNPVCSDSSEQVVGGVAPGPSHLLCCAD
jgi:hypothetical protein